MLRLPARPWTLKGSVTTRFALLLVLWSLMSLAVVACWFFLTYPALTDILRQQRIWDRGVRAADAVVRGKTTSHKFVLDSFDLHVSWHDEKRRPHEKRVEFSILFSGIGKDDPVEVRYDPASPDECALSWAVDHRVNRWITLVLGVAVSVLCLFGTGAVVRNLVRDHRFLQRLGEQGREVELDVLSFAPPRTRKQLGALVYALHGGSGLDAGGPAVRRARGVSMLAALGVATSAEQGHVTFKRSAGEFLWTTQDRAKVLALVDPEQPTRPLILGADLQPFAIGPTELEHLRHSRPQPPS